MLSSELYPVLDEIISKYLNGQSTIKLAKEYKCSQFLIYKVIKNSGTKMKTSSEFNRKYKINENFFDKIDTQEKAYIMGLLYADGCHFPEKSTINLALVKTDEELLKKISSLIYYNYRPLSFVKGKEFTSKKTNKTYIANDLSRFIISNKHISSILNNYGLVKAKSLTLKFPEWIEPSLISHFVRGYFDGDGSVYIHGKQNTMIVSICGTFDFCSSLKKITDYELGVKSHIAGLDGGQGLTKRLVFGGNTSSRKFLEWIYKDANIYLERKFLKYQEFLKIIPPPRIDFCTICGEKHYGKGYCQAHYWEFVGDRLRRERKLRNKNNKKN